MNRNTLIGALALIIVLGGIVWYAASRPVPAAPVQTTSFPPVDGPYAEHGQYFDITANYPTTTPMSAAADDAARSQMRAFIADQITQFKQQGNFDNLTQEDIQMMGYDQGRKESLIIKYLIASSPTNSPRTVSYIYTIYLDTLGAHPNGFFKTFTFDTQTGTLLSLDSVFHGEYLGTLSVIARAAVTEGLGSLAVPEMVNPGTEPDAKNFQNWFMDNTDFVLLFAPYDVAAYAAGPQTVRIPKSKIADILRPEYQ